MLAESSRFCAREKVLLPKWVLPTSRSLACLLGTQRLHPQPGGQRCSQSQPPGGVSLRPLLLPGFQLFSMPFFPPHRREISESFRKALSHSYLP